MIRSIYLNVSLFLAVSVILISPIDIPYLKLTICFILVAVFTNRRINRIFPSIFSNNQSWSKLILKSLLYASGIVALSFFVLQPIIFSLTKAPIDYGVFKFAHGNLPFLLQSLLAAWLVGGLMEETVFRAYFVYAFETLIPKKIALPLAIIAPSILFGYLHGYQGISGQFLTGCAGFILALIYILDGRNVWLNILTHGFMNTISLLLVYSGTV